MFPWTLAAGLVVLVVFVALRRDREAAPAQEAAPADPGPPVLVEHHRDPRFGPYKVVDAGSGRSGPIFESRDGFGLWELAGRPKLSGA